MSSALLAIIIFAQTLVPSPSSSPSSATPSPRPVDKPGIHITQDRQWWNNLSRHEKILVIEGEIDGLFNGWYRAFTEYDLKVELMLLTKKLRNSNDWLTIDTQLAKAYQEEKASPPLFSKTFGRYVNAIDEFYAKYPTVENVTVGEIMQCLSDKPWKSCPDIAKIFGSSSVKKTRQ